MYAYFLLELTVANTLPAVSSLKQDRTWAAVPIVPLINFPWKNRLPGWAWVVSLSLAPLAAWFEIPNIRRLFLALLDLDLRWWDSIKSFCINGPVTWRIEIYVFVIARQGENLINTSLLFRMQATPEERRELAFFFEKFAINGALGTFV